MADKYDGKAFNRPNDLWIDPKGGIYFTDPNYGGKPAKQPWCITRSDGDMFAFAGLYEVWRDPEAESDAAPIVSCTVLTREANEAMSAIHDRMPVMLAPKLWDDWLDRSNEQVEELLASIPPVPDELLTIHPVSTAVNNSRSRGAQLLERVEAMTDHDDPESAISRFNLAAAICASSGRWRARKS